MSINTLANWRARKPRRGPRFIKLGRTVRYMMRDVVAFERRNKR